MNAPQPTPIIPADADPIDHVEAMRLAYDTKNHPSKLRSWAMDDLLKLALTTALAVTIIAPNAANDDGPLAPVTAQRIWA